MIWLAYLVSLAALARLSHTDPKRRRIFGAAPLDRTPNRLVGWSLVLLPGCFLAVFGSSAQFVNWLGGTCAFGWMLIAVSPNTLKSLVVGVDTFGVKFEAWCDRKLGFNQKP
jgi:heme exporter protein D